MNPQISIVISTYGRLNEIDLLLSSLVIQDIERLKGWQNNYTLDTNKLAKLG